MEQSSPLQRPSSNEQHPFEPACATWCAHLASGQTPEVLRGLSLGLQPQLAHKLQLDLAESPLGVLRFLVLTVRVGWPALRPPDGEKDIWRLAVRKAPKAQQALQARLEVQCAA